jgi:hypothetical protein
MRYSRARLRRTAAFLFFALSLVQSPSDGKLIVAASAPLLAFGRDHERVTIHGIRGDLAIMISNPGVLFISGLRRSKTDATFIANRIAGVTQRSLFGRHRRLLGDRRIHQRLLVALAESRSLYPQARPNNMMNYVALDAPFPGLVTSARIGEKRFSHRLSVAGQKPANGDMGVRNYRVRVFSEDGDNLFSTLRRIDAQSVPKAIMTLLRGPDTYEFFESTVDGLRKNQRYSIQLWYVNADGSSACPRRSLAPSTFLAPNPSQRIEASRPRAAAYHAAIAVAIPK